MLDLIGIDILILIGLLMLNVPLPFCFGGALLFISLAADVSMKSLMLWGFGQMTVPVLLAGPLFILAGTIMSGSGIAKNLLDFVDIFIGKIKGGLGIICVVSCAVIGAISGSGFTGVAATGPIMIPRMVEQGYPRGYATALVSVSSILGLLIPPSIIMIIYGWVTDTSILACFISTVGPGILVTILFSLLNMLWSRKFNLQVGDSHTASVSTTKYSVIRAHSSVALKALPALLMPVIILGGIYGGVFTPTEAAAVAAVYSIPVGLFFYKGLNGKKIFKLFSESATSVGAIMTMITFCLMLSQTYVMLQAPQAIVELMLGLTQNKTLILLLINIILFISGMIVNDVTGMILLAPLLLPLVIQLGISPVHFSAIMGVNLAMGGVTPPYASILYLGMRIGKCEFSEIILPAMTFILFGYLPVVLLTTYWEPLSMFLPTLLGF